MYISSPFCHRQLSSLDVVGDVATRRDVFIVIHRRLLVQVATSQVDGMGDTGDVYGTGLTPFLISNGQTFLGHFSQMFKLQRRKISL